MNIHNQNWECVCGWTGHDDDLISECTFAGNREEPPEYEAYCPSCSGNWDQMTEPCEHVYQDDGDPRCINCNAPAVPADSDMECPSCSEIALPAKGGECGECHALAYF